MKLGSYASSKGSDMPGYLHSDTKAFVNSTLEVGL